MVSSHFQPAGCGTRQHLAAEEDAIHELKTHCYSQTAAQMFLVSYDLDVLRLFLRPSSLSV